MTIQRALDLADQLKPNMMSRQVKIGFLNEIENLIYDELVLTHYPEEQNPEAFLLARAKKMIEDELLLTSLQTKAEVVAFINTARGVFREEILRKQALIPATTLATLTTFETALQAKVQAADTFTKEQLVSFLEDVKDAIQGALPADAERPSYDTDTDEGTEMIIPVPYDMLYVYWLMSKIDHMNMEIDKFNNDRALFENAYEQASDWWTRTRMPRQKTREFRI